MQMGSEIHVDMYDDRLEIYSPGGMMDGRLIQQLNPLTVPSKRRNPLLADFFSRLGLMERRGSGMKKIINTYQQYEHHAAYRVPDFKSNASEFHVTLWNLNFEDVDVMDDDVNKSEEFANREKQFANPSEEFANGEKQFMKESLRVTKEFLKVSRQIYKLITVDPRMTTAQMAENLKISQRQVQKYLKRLQNEEKILRMGSRKNTEWKIIDEEYEGFFERI